MSLKGFPNLGGACAWASRLGEAQAHDALLRPHLSLSPHARDLALGGHFCTWRHSGPCDVCTLLLLSRLPHEVSTKHGCEQ